MAQQYSMVSSGWDVYGSDGEKIGTVDEVGQDYLLVRKGLIFTTDVYVPHNAITQIDADQTAAFVNVSKDAIDSQGWTEPPMSSGSYTEETTADEGYMATSTQSVGGTGYDTNDYATTGQTTDYATTDRTTDFATTGQTTDSDTIRVPRYEEELRAGTQTVEAGEVEVRKDVVQEQRTVEVPVTREDVEVRRVAVNREATADDAAFTDSGDTLRVPIREEQVVVSKEPRVVEELEIRKVATQDTEQVSDTVRREEVDVQRTGTTRTVAGDQHDHDISDR
jgi:uncharacterized protein (TIGR02271 family)